MRTVLSKYCDIFLNLRTTSIAQHIKTEKVECSQVTDDRFAFEGRTLYSTSPMSSYPDPAWECSCILIERIADKIFAGGRVMKPNGFRLSSEMWFYVIHSPEICSMRDLNSNFKLRSKFCPKITRLEHHTVTTRYLVRKTRFNINASFPDLNPLLENAITDYFTICNCTLMRNILYLQEEKSKLASI